MCFKITCNYCVSQIKEVHMKFYKSGKCFLTLYPDGTGTVLYPFKLNTERGIKDWVMALMRGSAFVPFDERFAQC